MNVLWRTACAERPLREPPPSAASTSDRSDARAVARAALQEVLPHLDLNQKPCD
ncbi:MAG: hypothetical protein JWM62_1174 [Frankiales bacterium]|jgi:hypothetical protein|nr:hypothetical protein [Frankiales bacterium]